MALSERGKELIRQTQKALLGANIGRQAEREQLQHTYYAELSMLNYLGDLDGHIVRQWSDDMRPKVVVLAEVTDAEVEVLVDRVEDFLGNGY